MKMKLDENIGQRGKTLLIERGQIQIYQQESLDSV
jgi:hypothetical protein